MPYSATVHTWEKRFNKALKQTRTLIEQAIWILKRRISCLHTELRVRPERCAPIIVSTVILHNIALTNNDELPCDEVNGNQSDESDEDDSSDDDDDDDIHRNGPVSQPEARRMRDAFARTHFS